MKPLDRVVPRYLNTHNRVRYHKPLMTSQNENPKGLQPAIKHIQDVFDESEFKCSWITQRLCFADLHPGTVIVDELTRHRAAFVVLRNIVGHSQSNHFDLTFSAGTASAIFYAYAEMYRYGLNTVVRDMFTDALQIGISNAVLIASDPVQWAKSQVQNRIQNCQHSFATWIKNVCDVQPFPTQMPLTDEDMDELVQWRKWRAPRFIHMRPSGNTPFDLSTTWTREDEHRTSQVLDSLSNRFTTFLEIALNRLVGRAYVQRAKQGLAVVPKPESVRDISDIDMVNERKFARMAIEEARKSIPERDGRLHPWVGALVVKNGEVLSVAHRGEIAEGNHAEFVALEKLADISITGATVFTTLEPCTTRTQPKVPCAQRLIDRKVARVVMGMLDPDERIRGLGQMQLRKANIATQFFPADLMSEVEELNREFSRDRERRTKQERRPNDGVSS